MKHKIVEVTVVNVEGENQYTPVCSCGWKGDASSYSNLQATADEHLDNA